MRPLPVALLLAASLAGCLDMDGAVEEARLEPGGVGPAAPWLLRTTGCGFCGGPGPWAQTFVLGGDGEALWFSFRPDVSDTGDEPVRPVDGVQMPSGAESMRPAVEAAVRVLQQDDVYWVQGRGVEVHDVRAWRVALEDRRVLGFLGGRTAGLHDPPPIEDMGCDDCSMPYLQVVEAGGMVGGPVQLRGSEGPGTGNVDSGSAWWSLESTLRHMHLQAGDASG